MAGTKPKQEPIKRKGRSLERGNPETVSSLKPSPQKAERKTPIPKIAVTAPIQAHEFDSHFKYEISEMSGYNL